MTNPIIEDLSLRTNNPFYIGNIFSFKEGDFSLDRDPIQVEKSIRDEYYTVIAGDTLSSIAFNKYGDSKEWWIIADVNFINWPFELEIGTTLLIPDLNKVKIIL